MPMPPPGSGRGKRKSARRDQQDDEDEPRTLTWEVGPEGYTVRDPHTPPHTNRYSTSSPETPKQKHVRIQTEDDYAPPLSQRVYERPKGEKGFHIATPPDYLLTHAHFGSCIDQLIGGYKDKVEGWEAGLVPMFANDYFNFEIPQAEKKTIIPTLRKHLSREAAAIVGFIADGGPKGKKGWEELFFEPELRRGLVIAIIGFVLQEHVFGSLCFGATEEQIAELHEDEIEQRDDEHDGFSRTAERAKKIRQFIEASERKTGRDSLEVRTYTLNFRSESVTLAWQIYALLWPILALSTTYRNLPVPEAFRRTSVGSVEDDEGLSDEAEVQYDIFSHLYKIVTLAARMHLRMRLDGDTIYHCGGVYKDQLYTPQTMIAFNEKTMNRTKEYAEEKDQEQLDEEFKLKAVRVVCWGVWSAYKKGGWMEDEKDMGIREFQVAKSLVVLRWTQGEENPSKYVPFSAVWGKGKKV